MWLQWMVAEQQLKDDDDVNVGDVSPTKRRQAAVQQWSSSSWLQQVGNFLFLVNRSAINEYANYIAENSAVCKLSTPSSNS